MSLRSAKLVNLIFGLRPKWTFRLSFGLSLWSQRKMKPTSEITNWPCTWALWSLSSM